MDGLNSNRLLPFFVLLAVIGSATANTLLQQAGVDYSLLSLALIFALSFLTSLGIFSIMWLVAVRWPKIGGVIMVVVYAVLGVSIFRASLDGSFIDSSPFRALVAAFTVLYLAVGVMVLISKKFAKNQVPPSSA